MKKLSLDVIKKSIHNKGYKWFDNELNIIGVRTADMTPDKWNDFMTFSWKDAAGKWNFVGFEATTDPGLFYLNNPRNVKGVGILVPDQYINIWQWAMGHNGYMQFLQLGGPVKAYRDNNRDSYFDMDPKKIDTGYFGMNGHRAHPTVKQQIVDKYSEMCQVIRSAEAWKKVEKIQSENIQKFYSYTLLTESEII